MERSTISITELIKAMNIKITSKNATKIIYLFKDLFPEYDGEEISQEILNSDYNKS